MSRSLARIAGYGLIVLGLSNLNPWQSLAVVVGLAILFAESRHVS